MNAILVVFGFLIYLIIAGISFGLMKRFQEKLFEIYHDDDDLAALALLFPITMIYLIGRLFFWIFGTIFFIFGNVVAGK